MSGSRSQLAGLIEAAHRIGEPAASEAEAADRNGATVNCARPGLAPATI